MNLAPFFLVGLPILTVLLVGLLGRTRRIGWWGAVLASIVLTPLGGFLATLMLGPKGAPRKAKRKKS
jgi:hypothetical protein